MSEKNVSARSFLLASILRVNGMTGTGVGSGGYAGDLTLPVIYVGDIDMYPPPRKI